MDYIAANIQRKEEFEDALLALMQEVPYEKITVKDLAEQMNLVRKTFYHYFPNKQACLDSLTDRLILECNMQLLQALPEDAGMYQQYAVRLMYWMEHRDFLNCIIRNGLSTVLLERYLAYARQEDRSIQLRLCTEKVHCDEDVLYFYMSGQIALLLKWCTEGFVLSVEELVNKLIRLVHEPPLLPECN